MSDVAPAVPARPTFLPTSSQHLQRCLRVAVQDRTTLRAAVDTHRQACRHPILTAALRRVLMAGGTASTRRRVYPALPSRRVRNCAHPAPEMPLARWGV